MNRYVVYATVSVEVEACCEEEAKDIAREQINPGSDTEFEEISSVECVHHDPDWKQIMADWDFEEMRQRA